MLSTCGIPADSRIFLRLMLASRWIDFICIDTILAINIRTALKCHNSLNFFFFRIELIFFSKFASLKNLSNETKLVSVSVFV